MNISTVILRRVTLKFNVVRIGAPLFLHPPRSRCVSTRLTSTPKQSLVSKIADKFNFSVAKSRLRANGYLLFESIADRLNYVEIFKLLDLPDTFYSWFVVTELHVWMLMVRYMAEGDDGRVVRNNIVKAFWDDVNHRTKKLSSNGLVGVNSQITDLSDQFNAALIAYDEGLQSNDVILGGALWRRLYQQKSVDPEHVDILCKYVRRQIKTLDNLTNLELFHNISVKWEPMKL